MSDASKRIGCRPTEDDERIFREAMRDDERTADVIRRALRLLDRGAWLSRARADAERLVDEDLSAETDAWLSAAGSTGSTSARAAVGGSSAVGGTASS